MSAPRPIDAPTQEGLWLASRLAEGGGMAHHIPIALRLRGPLDADVLGRALDLLAARHECLRLRFPVHDGRPCQQLADAVHVPLARAEAAGATPAEREASARAQGTAAMAEPFDLTQAPLMRARLVRLGADDHVLILVVHHLVWDGWSTSVLLDELPAALRAAAAGAPLALDPPFSYLAWARRARARLDAGELDDASAWWRERLAGLAVRELPLAAAPAAAASGAGAHRPLGLTGELSETTVAAARALGATPFMVLLAAWQALLRRYAGGERIVTATPIAGRVEPESERAIGCFVNVIALRVEHGGAPTFRTLVARVRDAALDAFDRADVPYHLLREPGAAAGPSCHAAFAFHNTPAAPLLLDGLAAERFDLDARPAAAELTLAIWHRPGEDLIGELAYDTGLFDADTVDRVARHYRTLLAALVAAPDAPVEDHELVLGAERERLLEAGAGDAAPYPRRPVHELVQARAAAAPDALALVHGDRRVTLGQMNADANRLARHLREAGVAVGDRVGLHVERSAALATALLAVLKAGAAYVPLDPLLPGERLRALLRDAGARVVVTSAAARERLADADARIVCLDRDAAAIARRPAGDLGLPIDLDAPAFVLYTSGSTGAPKGVLGSHRTIAARIAHEPLPFGDDERLCLKTAPSFIDALWELFAALTRGLPVVVAEREDVADPRRLLALLARERVTRLVLVPSLLRELLDAEPTLGAALPRLRTWIATGEPLAPELARRLLAAAPGTVLVNLYGTSECWDATWHDCRAGLGDGATVPVGRALANVRTYVCDERLRPAPAGAVGELLVGGPGVALGYLGRPELTAERFVECAFAPGERLYRTGDLARRRPDSALELHGRADGQLKLRGMRIEPGEVEAALLELDGVREAAVVAREDAGRARLVAYLVGDPAAAGSDGGLRAALRERLPDALVPAAFAWLERLPRTASGKLDRAALPAPSARPRLGVDYAAPATATERVLAGIWEEVLGVERVGAHDDFFELGGDSIAAVHVTARAGDAFALALPLRALFAHPTVAGLAADVELRAGGQPDERGTASPGAATDARPADAPRPLAHSSPADVPPSFAQERLWFLDQLHPGDPGYVVSNAFRLRGPLDRAALARALGELRARHATLRTGIATTPLGEPALVALPGEPPLLAHARVADERALRARVAEEARRPFDLARGPLLRALLLERAPEHHVLVLSVHHVAADGWSIGILLRELGVLYAAARSGRPVPLPAPALAYADVARWQRERLRNGRLDDQLAFWRARLAGLPALALPTARPRPPVQTHRGGRVARLLSPRLTAGLRACAQAAGATPFMVLLTAFEALLARHAGQSDVVVGTPVSGRERPETTDVVGLLVNLLALRDTVDAEASFAAQLAGVRERTLAALDHQELPFDRLVAELAPARDLSRHPLFQVLLVLQSTRGSGLSLDGLAVAHEPIAEVSTRFDLELQAWERGEQLETVLIYNADVFDGVAIERMAGHLERLLEHAAAGRGGALGDVPLLGDGERATLARRQGPRVDWDAPAGVHELMRGRGGGVACDGVELPAAEVHARANRLARLLRERGVATGARVGVCLERSHELAVAVLAALKAGAAFVPLDPDHPEERRAFMARDADVALVLGTVATLGTWCREVPALALDAAADELAAHPPEDPRVRVAPGDVAYVLYTSGSTGAPKGAANTHGGIVNRLLWMQERFRLIADDRVLQKTPIGFDVSVWELLWPLVAGARLVMAAPGGHRDPAYLVEAIRRERITVLHFVPSMLGPFLDAPGAAACTSLRAIVCSGEALPGPLARRARELLPDAELHNLYGPTEAAIDVTAWRCGPHDGDAIPIGTPIANTTAYVCDERGRLAPLGAVGELLIGGAGVALGYVNRPELTAERFVARAFAPGDRLYRTGDLVRWREDGALEYHGRADGQMKIRGARVEPGEIEAALLELDGVREAAVVARADERGGERLVAYLAGDAARAGDPRALRQRLARRLIEQMLPAAFVWLEALPLTPNGKLDRRALPALDPRAGRPEAEHVAPRDATERVLAGIWEEVLGVERVGVHDNFFELGGDSILSIQIIGRARSAGVELRPQQIFEHQTIAALAAAAAAGAAPPVAPAPPEPAGWVAAAPIQRWLLDGDHAEAFHFNQSVLLAAPEELTPAQADALLAALACAHPALRLVFRRRGTEWEQRVAEEPAPIRCATIDVRALPAAARAAAAHAQATAVQRSLDFARGPLLAAGLVEPFDGAPRRLLLAAHHLAVDTVSWGVLLEDLERAWARLRRGEPIELEPERCGYAAWAALQAERLAPEAGGELARWRALAPVARPLPRDRDGAGRCAATAEVLVTLDAGATRALLEDVPRRLGARVEEALLAALAEAVCAWSGEPALLVDVERHGREPLADGADVTRTVGWFTTLHPLRVAPVAGDPAATLRGVRRALRDVPRRGVGFGLLRRLGSPEQRAALAPVRAELLFNYLGRAGADAGGGAFAPLSGRLGEERSPRDPRTHLLEAIAAVAGGRLTARLLYAADVHECATVVALGERFAAALRELADAAAEDAPAAPADAFPLSQLDDADLDRVLRMAARAQEA